MQNHNPFMNVIVRKFARAREGRIPRPPELLPSLLPRGKSARALAPFAPPPDDRWIEEHCAMETFSLPCLGEHRPLRARAAKLAIAALLFAASLSASAAVREVGAIGLTVGDLDREVEFFTKVLSFEKVSEAKTAVGAADDLLGLNGTQLRTAELRLGGERITLTEHLTGKGRPIPADSRSFDRWFQHLAIVVRDMDKAYERLRAHKVKHVSTAPQTLPAWNKDAGGIKAFYFHDPEEHVLEIIWFPPDKGDPKWQPHAAGTLPAAGKAAPGGEDAGNTLFLGIDHTPIVVRDTDP